MATLYGADFRGELELDVPFQKEPFSLEFYAKPSKKLLDEVRSLPRGAKIAIDDFSRKDYDHLLEFTRTLPVEPLRNTGYFGRLLKIACDRQIQVLFLQSPDVFKTSAKHLLNKFELEELINEAEGSRKRSLERQLYANTVDYNYHSIISAECHALDVIREQKPDIVILSDYSANHLSDNKDCFSVYHRETLPRPELLEREFLRYLSRGAGPIHAERKLRENMLNNTIVTNAKKAQDWIQHDVILRKFHTLKNGRLTNTIPDLEGSWSSIPELGRMELYINEITEDNMMRGVYEDVYGTAAFSGRITEKEIEFTKLDSDKQPMFFYGIRNGDKYEGVFDHPGIEGPFELKISSGHQC